MHHRFAARDRNDRSSQVGQLIDTGIDYFDRDRLRGVIVFITVSAGEIAPSHRDQVGQNGMARRSQGSTNKTKLTQFLRYEFAFTHLRTNRNGLILSRRGMDSIKNRSIGDLSPQTQPPTLGQIEGALNSELRAPIITNRFSIYALT